MEPPFEVPPHLSPNGADPLALSQDDCDSEPILKFITQMLMEETEYDTLFASHNSLALKATEKSLDNVLAGNGSIDEFVTHKETVLHFNRGLEEANNFLLHSSSGKGKKKNHQLGDVDLVQGRSNKQPAVYTDETELSQMFDNVSLFGAKGVRPPCFDQPTLENKPNRNSKRRVKEKPVDFRTMLMVCAQAVSSYDQRTADELLKQIRRHSSPSGDGSQRLAHYFANGLEARLAGTATALLCYHNCLASRGTFVDVLKAYHLYLAKFPFMKFCIAFANKQIMDLAEKRKTIHIVDFGIGYGFHWPNLIQHLGHETATTPKLRITGIDLPQPGFRPTQGIEVAGRRLASYCERFNVPFEYNAIASKNWETIQLEELKLDESDALVVNCLFRSQTLFDEIEDSPRDSFLGLIKEMNPNVFIHSIGNGSYNSPFFITRFREALFHHSAQFDMWDTIISREDQRRTFLERDMYGWEAMNVISCEGSERIERPEPYKQWQTRTVDAGFRQLPLSHELVNRLRNKLKLCGYHKDFMLDEGGKWMLQGWKGRILHASSCWAPAHH